jgi:hypothetical protein
MAVVWAKRWTPAGSKLIVALFVIAATVVSVVTFDAVAQSPGAGANTATTTTTTAASGTPFNNGSASAAATALQVAPALGQLNLAVQLGTSEADFEYSQSQALSQSLDIGALTTVLTAPSCGGQAAFQASAVPQPVQAESTNGDQSLHSEAETSLNGTGAGVGDEDAAATQVPAGTSTTTIASDDLAGLIDISGATTSATTEVQNGDERYATASTDFTSISIAKGLIVLKGLHWAAVQTSGATSSSASSFAIGGLTIAGVAIPITSDSISTITTLINTALEPGGFEIKWPTSFVQSDGTQVISPLTIGIDNSALGQEVLGSQLNTIQPIRNELVQDLLGINNCTVQSDLNGLWLVFDLTTGIAAGGGELNLNVGGATAATNNTEVSDPFGGAGSAGLGSDLGSSALPDTPTSLPFTSSTFGTGSSGQTTSTSLVPSNEEPTDKMSLGPVSKSVSCHSIGPAGGGCGTSDVAVPVAIIWLVLLGLLAGSDFVRQRRRAPRDAITGEAG